MLSEEGVEEQVAEHASVLRDTLLQLAVLVQAALVVLEGIEARIG